MKKTFQVIGIMTLLIGSFMYTEKVSNASKLTDDLLEQIKQKKETYTVYPKEAAVTSNTIIPGKNGKKVLVKESYQQMKEIGYFNEKLLKYKKIIIKNQLKDNKDKYIVSANQTEKQIALIFKIDSNDSIDDILNKLKNEKATFYINSTYLENHYNSIIKLLKNGHTIGVLNSNDYANPEFIWTKTIINKYQKNNFCYTDKKDNDILNSCKVQSMYTIMNKTISNKHLITVKKELKPGFLFVFETNNELIEELENIINYINAKGYKIKSLEKILDET